MPRILLSEGGKCQNGFTSPGDGPLHSHKFWGNILPPPPPPPTSYFYHQCSPRWFTIIPSLMYVSRVFGLHVSSIAPHYSTFTLHGLFVNEQLCIWTRELNLLSHIFAMFVVLCVYPHPYHHFF